MNQNSKIVLTRRPLACSTAAEGVMPARTTLTYSSAENGANTEQLHTYYCKFSGSHALSTDCDLSKAPRRRTDGAIVLDTEFYAVRLYAKEGGVKLLKRASGAVERQVRVNIGQLPIAYRSELGGRFLYIYKDSLSEYSGQPVEGGATKAQRPVPPCITQTTPDTVQVVLEVDDRAPNATLVKISRDFLRIQIVHGIGHDKASEELLEFMRGILGVRSGQLSIVRGESTRQKTLLVQGMKPEVIFERLEASL